MFLQECAAGRFSANSVKAIFQKTPCWLTFPQLTSILVFMQAQSLPIQRPYAECPYDSGMRKLNTRPKGIGARLTELRLQANLSQKDLAERIGVPVANIGFWERTNTPPSSKALPRLAEELGTTVEELLTGKNGKKRHRGGPPGRLRETFDHVAKLPRKQQQKILDVVDALLAQSNGSK